jgi:hypothetical protein
VLVARLETIDMAHSAVGNLVGSSESTILICCTSSNANRCLKIPLLSSAFFGFFRSFGDLQLFHTTVTKTCVMERYSGLACGLHALQHRGSDAMYRSPEYSVPFRGL